MYYLMAAISTVGIGLQFSCMKLYQKHTKSSLLNSMVFNIIVSAIIIPLLFILGGFKLEFTTYSFLIAIALAVISVLTVVFGIKTIKYGKLSVYSMFMMLGGMLVPFAAGLLFWSEPMTILKGAGIVILSAALVFSSKDKSGKSVSVGIVFFLLCLAIFFLNGLNSAAVTLQQQGDSLYGYSITDLYSFLIWSRLSIIGISVLIVPFALIKPKEERRAELLVVKESFRLKPLLAMTAYAAIVCVGSVLNLTVAAKLDASIFYPILSGGSIISSVLFGRLFFKEKISRFTLICLLFIAAGTILFMF